MSFLRLKLCNNVKFAAKFVASIFNAFMFYALLFFKKLTQFNGFEGIKHQHAKKFLF